jgi:predicted dehydrogenase
MSHVSVIESLCDSHCPIFVEKPLAPSLEDVRKLEQRAGDRIFVMQKWRYHPGIEELSRLASSKEFGLLKSACSRRVQWSHPHKDVDASWILAPHDMAIIQHIFGKIPEVRFGYGEKVGNRMESLIAVLGKDPSAVIEVSSLRPKTVRLVVVRFEGAIASLNDPLADHIEIKRIDMETGAIAESSEIRSISTEFPLLRELKVFLDFLNGGPPPPTDIQSEISIIKSITEARRLAESNSSAG